MNSPFSAAHRGIAITMPSGPIRALPTTSAARLMAGWTCTADCITFGETTLSVIFCATTVTSKVQRAKKGLIKNAKIVAAAAETQGPTTGTRCMMPVRTPMSKA